MTSARGRPEHRAYGPARTVERSHTTTPARAGGAGHRARPARPRTSRMAALDRVEAWPSYRRVAPPVLRNHVQRPSRSWRPGSAIRAMAASATPPYCAARRPTQPGPEPRVAGHSPSPIHDVEPTSASRPSRPKEVGRKPGSSANSCLIARIDVRRPRHREGALWVSRNAGSSSGDRPRSGSRRAASARGSVGPGSQHVAEVAHDVEAAALVEAGARLRRLLRARGRTGAPRRLAGTCVESPGRALPPSP
jgi:hypothetical protein